jgi:hypothetical protein
LMRSQPGRGGKLVRILASKHVGHIRWVPGYFGHPVTHDKPPNYK